MSLVAVAKRYLFQTKSQELVLRLALLCMIYIYAFAIRLFSVLRYESVIHEFDPYFNYRSTIKLVNEGFYEFWNWFDTESWYPLGRVVGGTVYPGLMITAAATYKALTSLSAWVSLRDVCVLTAPFFAGNTAMIAYCFGKELKDTQTGLAAAALMAIVPGYISRSVAGSFDNEAVAIFALLLTFYLFVSAVRLGTMSAAVAAAFGYLYMASSWGAYVFISNLIPLYVLIMIACRRYNSRVYAAYTTFWAIGGPLAMQIRFIGSNHITSHELLAFNGVWAGLQLWEVLLWVQRRLTAKQFGQFVTLAVLSVVGMAVSAVILLTVTGKMSPWTGRFWTLLDPTYAKKYIPIIASVSEHQPTTWASYVFDLHLLVFTAPAGLYFCFQRPTDANIFLLTFALTSIYFSGIMVRLMLVAAPAFVLLGALATSETLTAYARDFWEYKPPESAAATPSAGLKKKPSKKVQVQSDSLPAQREVALLMMTLVCCGLIFYSSHCSWVTQEAYSSPSIVLIGGWGPNRYVLDDFREAYYWLRHNTVRDAKIMSWWDYGYQITAMGNRTVIVDNNTWNNTHIATVGRAMASSEADAYPIMRQLDVDYVLIIFGGLSGYSSDDINKFLWMVRIGGGVFPQIKEKDYLNKVSLELARQGRTVLYVPLCMMRISLQNVLQANQRLKHAVCVKLLQLCMCVWRPIGEQHHHDVNQWQGLVAHAVLGCTVLVYILHTKHVAKENGQLQAGEYTISSEGTQTMMQSLMYKLSYHDFGRVMTEGSKPAGYDRVRQVEIGLKEYGLEHVEEAFTSEHWIVRVYKVKPLDNRT